MKKFVTKIGIILLLIIIINVLNIFNNKTYATADITDNLEYWRPSVLRDSDKLSQKVSGITGTIRVIGILVSVATLSVIGIKYMLGSVEEKAQYKQIFIPWIIGAIMVFAITTIPTLIYEVTTEMFSQGSGGASNPIGPGGEGLKPGFEQKEWD